MVLRFLIAGTLLFFLALTVPSTYSAQLNNGEIIRLVNGFRQSQGLRPLKENVRLRQSARLKVNDMARKRYFGHTNPEGERFERNIQRVRYPYTNVAEILARGCDSERSALNVWIDSPRHRDAILDPVFRDIGCSSIPGRNDGWYIACHLGTTAR